MNNDKGVNYLLCRAPAADLQFGNSEASTDHSPSFYESLFLQVPAVSYQSQLLIKINLNTPGGSHSEDFLTSNHLNHSNLDTKFPVSLKFHRSSRFI